MKHILIDADTGIDDSIAILYALKSPYLHVEGITTCFGNSGAEQSAENSSRLIGISHCGYDVPVVVGAKETLDGESKSAPAHIHGDNGIGNVVLPATAQKPLDMDAADFILEKARELNGELIIVTTGRLTNLARALQKDPTLPRQVKGLVVMGGCVAVHGNVSPVAEANIAGDARASDLVFRAGFPMLLVGLDVTTKTFITAKDVENALRFCREDSRESLEYIRQALAFYFEFHRVSEGMVDCCFVHDPLAMLLAEDPTLGTYRMIRARVEYACPAYAGKIVLDERFQRTMEHGEIAACMEVDADLAIRRLFSVFC